MLDYIWFAGLSGLGWLFSYLTMIIKDKDFDHAYIFMASFSAMILSLGISWDGIGRRCLRWLDYSLPQTGTHIHDITMYFILGAIALVWVFHPGFIIGFFQSRSEND